MFYFLQKRKVLQFFLIAVAIAFFCFRLFTMPLSFTHCEPFLPCAQWIAAFVASEPTVCRIAVLAVILAEALLIARFFRKSSLLDKPSYLPVLWFVALMSVGSYILPLTPAFITNFVVVCLVNLNGDYQNERVKMQVLLSGILIGLASFIDITAALLVLYVIVAIAVNRVRRLKDILVALIGFAVPYIYMLSWQFFTGNLQGYLTSFLQFDLRFPLQNVLHSTIPDLIALVVFILLFPYVLIELKRLFDNKLVVIRQRYVTLNILLLTLLLMVVLSNLPFPQSLAYFFVPLSFYFTALIPEKRFSTQKEIILLLMAASFVVIGLPL